jgi:hypothetical protein
LRTCPWPRRGAESAESFADRCRCFWESLDNFRGPGIHAVERLVGAAFPREFVQPLARTFVDDPDDARRALTRGDGRGGKVRVEHTRGVHDQDILAALARLVGADTAEAAGARGCHARARFMRKAIRRALTAP